MALHSGELFDDRYQLVRVLGSGGVGTVFEAHDRVFDRRVALKVLQFEAPEGLEAFRREFLLLSGTAHPHLVRCLDFGSGVHAGNRTHYFTSELVSGVHLLALDDDTFRRQALAALLDAVEALAWLHQSRLLHGDLKPENILLAERGGVLIDLSCARRIPAHQGIVSGTPGFIAPEVVRGGAVDARADVYAVGRTLDLLGRRLGSAFPTPLAELAARALREDPAQRPLDAAELLDVLHRTLAGKDRGVRVPPIGAPRELLGRDAERLRATQALEDFFARRPGPRVIVISGPPGIGKTRLFRELKWWAQQRFTVFEGVTRGPDPLCKLLARAVPTLEHESGVDATLRARAELAAADRRVVLALDDAHDLPGSDALLLEALLRASTRSDACCWLVSTASAPPFADPNVLALPLRPLNEAAIATWTAPYLSAVPAKQVAAWTGGVPQSLYEICSELARGEIREAELFADGAPRTADLRWHARVSALHADCTRALCLMSVLETPQPRDRLARLGVSSSVLDELEGWGFLRLDGDTALLSRTRDARAIRAHFGQARVRELAALAAAELRGELSEALPRSERELRVARAAHLDVLAERLDSAEAALTEAARASCAWAPDAWLACATELCGVHPTPENWERLAVVKDARGDLDGAIAAIVSGLRQRPAAPLTAALLCQAAFCHEKLGHVSRAVRLLRRAERVCRDDLAGARSALVEARCCLREGRYREATTIATRALGSASGSHAAAQLHEVAALAFGYLGTPKEAERHLEQALTLHGPDLPPRARVRLVSYCALQAYRSGQAQLATSYFTEALELAEQSGLGDLLATAALNAGTAAHQAGDWGAALSAYERGLRAATAYGKDRTRATLRFNLAKLFADIGALERAEQHLASVEADLRHGGLRELEGAILGLCAEIACARGEFDGALELLNEASALHAASGRTRELVEADLQRVDVLLKLGQLADATRVLEENAPRLGPLAAPDLELRQALASASVALRAERNEAALAHVEHALRCDDAVGQVALRAELQALMSELYSRTGASHLADQARRSSRAAWERVSLKLP
ncbi:MAG TPA: protein kinase, partial [Polyangiaceae bacterium]